MSWFLSILTHGPCAKGLLCAVAVVEISLLFWRWDSTVGDHLSEKPLTRGASCCHVCVLLAMTHIWAVSPVLYLRHLAFSGSLLWHKGVVQYHFLLRFRVLSQPSWPSHKAVVSLTLPSTMNDLFLWSPLTLIHIPPWSGLSDDYMIHILKAVL